MPVVLLSVVPPNVAPRTEELLALPMASSTIKAGCLFTLWAMLCTAATNNVSCRLRVAEKLGSNLLFHSSKRKTEKLVLSRNILNQLNKVENVSLGGLNVSQWQLQSMHCMVFSEWNLHCSHVDGIMSQKDTSYSIFLSELCNNIKMYFSYCFKCLGCSCVCMSNYRIFSFWESPHI